MTRLTGLVLAVLWLLPGAGLVGTANAAEDAVGIVAEYRPASARFKFGRNGKDQVPVRIGAMVMVGDSIDLPAGAAVIVQQRDGQRLEFSGPGRFEVPAAPPLGKVSAIFRSISAVFDDEYRLAGTAASRSGEDCGGSDTEVRAIEVPILTGAPAVVAGERDLPLTWIGGCTPFSINLQAADGRSLYRESVEGRQVRLDDVPLKIGRYTITISDATGLEFRGTVEAVAAAPKLPA
ncbi:MAG: hypothetical protein KJ040_01535, partial [Gammaproteobacteria bacterium]|nr:hypothetical protein [Gammaproteobacteria bacterium]